MVILISCKHSFSGIYLDAYDTQVKDSLSFMAVIGAFIVW